MLLIIPAVLLKHSCTCTLSVSTIRSPVVAAAGAHRNMFNYTYACRHCSHPTLAMALAISEQFSLLQAEALNHGVLVRPAARQLVHKQTRPWYRTSPVHSCHFAR
ncbi:hypothetical protein FKM82_006107 [Ascaphus truei]